MKATIKLYKNDGEGQYGFPVKLVLSHNRKTRRKTIGYSKECDWNISKNLPAPTHDDFEDLYSIVMDIEKKSFKMEFRDLENFEDAFDYLLSTSTRSKKTADFYEWGDRCVDLLQSQDKIGTAQSYKNSIDALKKFSPKLKFSEITPYFLNDFKNHCRARGNQNKTIKHYGGALKAIYNRAVASNVTKDANPFKGFSKDIPTRDRRKKQRYLEPESIKKLEAAVLPPGQQIAVDLSLLQFYLGGADFIEIYYLKNEQLANGRVFFTRQKLSDIAFEFDVLVPENAKVIIEKYQVKGEYVFPWRKDEKGYQTYINRHRRTLQTVQEKLEIELLPKNEKLTTKVMRHTFATLGKFARVEEDMLREMMGHERKDTDTIYKAKYLEAERDAAQLKIIGENQKTKKVRKAKMKVKRL